MKLREEDCSAFGRLVLQYLKDNPQISMSELARQVKLSHAGLSWICLKRSSPNEETAGRVAQVIGADFNKIARLVHENKLEKLASLSNLNYVAKLDKKWVSRPIPVEDAIAGLNAVFHAYHYVVRNVPEVEKPTDFQIYKESYEIVSGQFVNNGKRFVKTKSQDRL
ncbi:MAG: winged helix-turn-helix domain-containing protein [Timaviella obliquedivisa GSE-PSE-MK23-08B]|jgi:transcriptional regulator with XRE-family HTH domain|nr:winged helix-turn-helix domain-containing protein [Timaviella obliquedivisa GSE-PSE-MK23-08B]